MVYVAHLAYGCPAGQDYSLTSPEGRLIWAYLPSLALSFAEVPAERTNWPPFPASILCCELQYPTEYSGGAMHSQPWCQHRVGYNYIPVLEPIECQCISLFSVCVMEKGDVCTPCWDHILFPATFAGIPSLSLLKSIILYFLLAPPPL